MKKKNSLSISNIIKSGFSSGSSGREAAIEHKKHLLSSGEEVIEALTGGPMGAVIGKTYAKLINRRAKSRAKRKRVKANIPIREYSNKI